MDDLRRSGIRPWVKGYKWPIYFFVAVAFWNLLGAGVFGFMINLGRFSIGLLAPGDTGQLNDPGPSAARTAAGFQGDAAWEQGSRLDRAGCCAAFRRNIGSSSTCGGSRAP
mgnify:CR=1 FL=1